MFGGRDYSVFDSMRGPRDRWFPRNDGCFPRNEGCIRTRPLFY